MPLFAGTPAPLAFVMLRSFSLMLNLFRSLLKHRLIVIFVHFSGLSQPFVPHRLNVMSIKFILFRQLLVHRSFRVFKRNQKHHFLAYLFLEGFYRLDSVFLLILGDRLIPQDHPNFFVFFFQLFFCFFVENIYLLDFKIFVVVFCLGT